MSFGIKESIVDLEKHSYATEESVEEFVPGAIDCSSGINPFGCSEKVKEKLREIEWEEINLYPESNIQVKEAIARYWKEWADLKQEQIFLGDGSIGIIYRINKLFLDGSSKVLGYSPQFTDYIDDVVSYGSRYECYLLDSKNNFAFDVDQYLAKMSPQYKLFYLDHPNNPTGQIIDGTSLEKIVRKAEELKAAVIIDEAYGDFMEPYQSAIPLTSSYPNLFVIRSFSKGMGLAGLRAAYVVTSKRLGYHYSTISNPYEMNGLARNLILPALEDRDFIKESNEKINGMKKRFIHSLHKLQVLETHGNTPILTIKHPDSQVDFARELKGYGIIGVSGRAFIGLDPSYVRIRLPREVDPLIIRFQDVESDIR